MANGQQMQRREQQAPVSNAQRLEELREHMLGRADDLTRALAGLMPAEKFVEIAITAIATIKEPETRAKVLACTPDSIALAVVQAAHAGLRIDGRQSALVPYGHAAQWTPMVKGRIDLILRVPHVAGVVTGHVLECDQFEYWRDESGDHIKHAPNFNPPPDSPLVCAYAIIRYKDGRAPTVEVIGRARIDKIRGSFSKAPDSPAWKKSFNEMAQKVALNRAERMIDTDPDVARAMAHAMAAEFELPDDDPRERASERVQEQVAAAREKLEKLKLPAPAADGQPQSEEPSKRVQNAEAARYALRVNIRQQINGEVERQKLSHAEAVKEMKAALELAGFQNYVRFEDGAPDVKSLTLEEMTAVLEHLRALGPGFAQGQQEAPEAAAESQDRQEEPQEGEREPEPGSGRIDEGGATKVDELQCRKIGGKAKDARVHLRDPLKAEKPPRCIGCGCDIGATAGAAGFQAVSDHRVYCPKALDAVDAQYPAERVPQPILDALLARARS